jgi:hypothetical protein
MLNSSGYYTYRFYVVEQRDKYKMRTRAQAHTHLIGQNSFGCRSMS